MLAPLIIAILGSLGLAVSLQEMRPQVPVMEKVTFRFNERKPSISADGLRLISFGYSRMLSNLLWLRFLQFTPSDKVPDGKVSWIYFDLDTITTLDPDFYPAFEHGGIFLSVVTEDRKGAELLLNKGLRLHPSRWRMYAYLAYHYQFELDEPEKAADLYLNGSRLPDAPPLLGILAARHMAKTKSFESSIEFLENLKRSSRDEVTRKRLQERIDMWKRKFRGDRS
jgi:hypothetical protein